MDDATDGRDSVVVLHTDYSSVIAADQDGSLCKGVAG